MAGLSEPAVRTPTPVIATALFVVIAVASVVAFIDATVALLGREFVPEPYGSRLLWFVIGTVAMRHLDDLERRLATPDQRGGR